MDRLIRFRFVVAAAAFTFAAAALTARVHASTLGYLLLQQFSVNSVPSTSHLTLSGAFTNYCNGGLPAGALLRIQFDTGTLLKLPITASGFGQTQRFTQTVAVPQVPRPHNNVTSYRFSILVPPGAAPPNGGTSVRPDMKTSPCLVTGVLGIPSA